MKTALEKKYSINLDNITEKDIIYFCRDALAINKKNENKVIYEKEILEIIKSKEWDWFTQDIDKNVILTYPIRNNAFNIVKYLLENKKYNLQEYNEKLSGAVKSCIALAGNEMCEYLLSQDLHQEYIEEMAFQAYIMSDYVVPQYRLTYLEKAIELTSLNTDFSKILNKFLNSFSSEEFKKIKLSFVKFLDTHPLSKEEKLNIMKPIIESGLSTMSPSMFFKSEKNRMIDNYVRYIEMETRMPPRHDNIKKPKI